MSTTVDLYRPVGASTPIKTGIECEVIERIAWTAGYGLPNPSPGWTHEFRLPKGTQLHQAATFNNHLMSGWHESTADELRIGPTRYVVAWVLRMDDGTVRAFCIRYGPMP